MDKEGFDVCIEMDIYSKYPENKQKWFSVEIKDTRNLKSLENVHISEVTTDKY